MDIGDDDIDDYLDGLSSDTDSDIPATNLNQGDDQHVQIESIGLNSAQMGFGPDPTYPHWADIVSQRRSLTQLMDIQEPLTRLRSLIEDQLQSNLDGYEFWLQDSQIMPEQSNLIEQCVQGEGVVQINVQIVESDDEEDLERTDVMMWHADGGHEVEGLPPPIGRRRINIIDVIMPDIIVPPPRPSHPASTFSGPTDDETNGRSVLSSDDLMSADDSSASDEDNDSVINLEGISSSGKSKVGSGKAKSRKSTFKVRLRETKRKTVKRNGKYVQSLKRSPHANSAAVSDQSSAKEAADNQWIISREYDEIRRNRRIPDSVAKWTKMQVQTWIRWLEERFKLPRIRLRDWQISGQELIEMSLDDFLSRMPANLANDDVSTHFELLRQCQCVAVPDKLSVSPKRLTPTTKSQTKTTNRNQPLSPADSLASKGGKLTADSVQPNRTSTPSTKSVLSHSSSENVPSTSSGQHQQPTTNKKPVRLGVAKDCIMTDASRGNRSGNNGHVQLWQFLLDLLTSHEHLEAIHWTDEPGQFVFSDPKAVAQLWGRRKRNEDMNYEKLSRALRYYYDGDMICKVPGQRFVYKFVVDLEQVIGYSAVELNKQVRAAGERSLKRGLMHNMNGDTT